MAVVAISAEEELTVSSTGYGKDAEELSWAGINAKWVSHHRIYMGENSLHETETERPWTTHLRLISYDGTKEIFMDGKNDSWSIVALLVPQLISPR